jgi:type I restriction enzyme S subunit
MSDKVNPVHWEKVQLSQIVTPRRGISYTADQLADKTSDCPLYINMKSFRKDASYNEDGEKFFADSFSETDLLQKDELLIVNTDVTPQGEILGVPVRLPDRLSNAPTLFSHHVTALRHEKSVSKIFLYYKLAEDQTRKVIRSFGRGTTVKMLNLNEMLETEILIPTFPEQQKIAEILTSVDEVIENTQSQINKLEDLKKATMNELLTEGIGHTEFKETEMGSVPRSWTVQALGTICIVKGGKRIPKGMNFSNSITLHPYLRVTDFLDGTISEKDIKYVDDEVWSFISRYTISDNDLYISIAGTVGLVGQIPKKYDGSLLTENAAKITVNTPTLTKEFLMLQMNSAIIQRQLNVATGVGGGVPKLALFRIQTTQILVPPIAEQVKIVRILSEVYSLLSSQRSRLKLLTSIKTGLMQDLLTGKVRVTVN